MNSNENVSTVQNTINRTETGQTNGHNPVCPVSKSPTRLAKTHQDFWKSRLRKRSFLGRDGRQNEIPEWQVRMFHAGKEGWFNLGTANKTVASAKARDIYLSLIQDGWEKTLRRFKPGMTETTKTATIGEFLAQVKAVSGLRPGTFEIYAGKFRTLVASVFGLHGGKEKFDYVHGGNQKYLERIDRVNLGKLTAKRIQAWKVRYLESAKDPLANKRAHTTVNSVIRAGKALFAPKIRKFLTVCLPNPLPFDGVDNVRLPKARYHSEFNPLLLLAQAKRELAEAQPMPLGEDARPWQVKKAQDEVTLKHDAFKVLLLALGAGLRRDEMDTLSWSQLDFNRNVIRVETTAFTHVKSDESEAEVDVDPDLMAIFKGYMAGSKSPFVINSPVAPRPKAHSYHHYRCNRIFDHLILWLHSKGIVARNALHSLRKEYGSQICKQAGIFAASVALRHGSIQLTRDHYLDKKEPAVFKVGDILNAKPAPISEAQEA